MQQPIGLEVHAILCHHLCEVKARTNSGWRANDSCRNTEGGQHARTNGVCSGIRNTASHMRLLSAQAFAAQEFMSFIFVCDAECMLQALQRGRQVTQLPCRSLLTIVARCAHDLISLGRGEREGRGGEGGEGEGEGGEGRNGRGEEGGQLSLGSARRMNRSKRGLWPTSF